MGDSATVVVDTNVLLNLALPVVDGRESAPSGQDPFLAVLSAYDVHVPDAVLGEVSEMTTDDDLLATAGELVLQASQHLTAHAVGEKLENALDYGLDTGESRAIWLANELDAEVFVTDEFNSSSYLLIALALENRNTLYTTPHVLCSLANHDVLDTEYVDAALTYYEKTKGWEHAYVEQLRLTCLHE